MISELSQKVLENKLAIYLTNLLAVILIQIIYGLLGDSSMKTLTEL